MSKTDIKYRKQVSVADRTSSTWKTNYPVGMCIFLLVLLYLCWWSVDRQTERNDNEDVIT